MPLDWSCALAGADASRAVVTAGPSGHQAISRLETANALGVMAQQRD